VKVTRGRRKDEKNDEKQSGAGRSFIGFAVGARVKRRRGRRRMAPLTKLAGKNFKPGVASRREGRLSRGAGKRYAFPLRAARQPRDHSIERADRLVNGLAVSRQLAAPSGGGWLWMWRSTQRRSPEGSIYRHPFQAIVPQQIIVRHRCRASSGRGAREEARASAVEVFFAGFGAGTMPAVPQVGDNVGFAPPRARRTGVGSA